MDDLNLMELCPNKQVHPNSLEVNQVFLKTELEDANEFEEEENDSDSDLELSKIKEKLKIKVEEKSEDEDKNLQYEILEEIAYTTLQVKEEPINDIRSTFKENNLEIEKQKYYQQIMEKIWEDSENINLKDLQNQYLKQLRLAASIETYICLFCSYQTINMTNLKCHLFLIHNKKVAQKMFKCKTCSFKHEYKVSILKHLEMHQKAAEPENVFNCQQCGYIGPSKRALKSHIKKLHSEPKLPFCDLCSFEGKDSKDLKKHMGTHKTPGTQRYKCYECDHEVAHKVKLARHLMKVHQIENDRIKKLQYLNCPHCDYTTYSKSGMQNHSLVHKDSAEIQYFYCDKCSFKCKQKHGIKRHILLVHTEKTERVYTQMCDKCSYKCERPSMLKRHLLTHLDKSEINEMDLQKCSLCPFVARSRSNLSSHMYMHSDKVLKCDLCGFETKRPRNMNFHKKLHMKSSELKIYKCELCTYQSKFKQCLVNHMKQGDHTGKNLKHIPHKFRIENQDDPNFNPANVRFGGPKKYPKYPKKNSDVQKNELSTKNTNNIEGNVITLQNQSYHSWEMGHNSFYYCHK